MTGSWRAIIEYLTTAVNFLANEKRQTTQDSHRQAGIHRLRQWAGRRRLSPEGQC